MCVGNGFDRRTFATAHVRSIGYLGDAAEGAGEVAPRDRVVTCLQYTGDPGVNQAVASAFPLAHTRTRAHTHTSTRMGAAFPRVSAVSAAPEQQGAQGDRDAGIGPVASPTTCAACTPSSPRAPPIGRGVSSSLSFYISMAAYFEVSISHAPAAPGKAAPHDVGAAAAATASASPPLSQSELPTWYRAPDALGGTQTCPRRPPALRQPACIAVGLATRRFPLLGRMPGWDGNSYGYHGDDGSVFHGSGFGQPYGPVFGPGDTVGCGLLFCNDDERAPALPRRTDDYDRRLTHFVDACTVARLRPRSPGSEVPADSVRPLLLPPLNRDDWNRMLGAVKESCSAVAERCGELATETRGWRRLLDDVIELEIREEEDALLDTLTRRPASSRGPFVFFTLNGRALGVAHATVASDRTWYACVGLDAPYVISANFGAQPFAFDILRLHRTLWSRVILRALPPVPQWVRTQFPVIKRPGVPAGAVVANVSGVSMAPPPPFSHRRSRTDSFESRLHRDAGATVTVDKSLTGSAVASPSSKPAAAGSSRASVGERIATLLTSAAGERVIALADAFPAARADVALALVPVSARCAPGDVVPSAAGSLAAAALLKKHLSWYASEIQEYQPGIAETTISRSRKSANRSPPMVDDEGEWILRAEPLPLDAVTHMPRADGGAPARDAERTDVAFDEETAAASVAEDVDPMMTDTDDDVRSIDSDDRRRWRK